MLSRAARRTGRLAVAAPLAVLYTAGFLAAIVVVACVTCGSAVRLGWSDMKNRGVEHGSA